jgi:hypothetical protein
MKSLQKYKKNNLNDFFDELVWDARNKKCEVGTSHFIINNEYVIRMKESPL